MSRVTESVKVEASLAEVWDYYFDPRGWPAWVDGFASVAASDGYPDAGGSLRWRSIPAGRGEVSERVLEHDARRVHRVGFEDPASTGELRTEFAIDGRGTRVTQDLEYRLRSRGPFAKLTDALFIRSQMRGSLRRSLDRLRLETEEPAVDPSPPSSL